MAMPDWCKILHLHNHPQVPTLLEHDITSASISFSPDHRLFHQIPSPADKESSDLTLLPLYSPSAPLLPAS